MAKLETVSSAPRAAPKERSALKSLAWTAALLLLVLGFLFSRSFDPSLVLFANDAPLGALVSQEKTAIQNFFGAWQPLNWIGSEQPSAQPNVTYAFYLTCGALAYAKFFVPFTLLLLGISIWFAFRQMGFSPATCVLGAIAGSLNTEPFSMACWGLAPITVSMAAGFAALGAIASGRKSLSWLKLCLAGSFVGVSIMEGYDVGAILSLYVAAFVLFQTWLGQKLELKTIAKATSRVAVVAVFAAFMAAFALSTLVATQIKGIVGVQQDSESKEKRWNEATTWSLPKIETLRVIVPGVFGYRMDTQAGGNYWGAVGRRPGWEEDHKGQARSSGTGLYAGVLVVLLATWALFRSLKRPHSVFSDPERKLIWFWSAMALISLLLAFGRHAPFYQIVYHLPYFSTIRNPIKFLHPFSICLLVLFGYGLQGVQRLSSGKNITPTQSSKFKLWWSKVPRPEKAWIFGSTAFFAACLLAALIFVSSRAEMERHLVNIGFPQQFAPEIFHFSAGEMGWFLLFLALSLVVIALALGGTFSGHRAKWTTLLFGALIVGDLSRADSPWIVYYNYRDKYATNPVVDILREKPFERRVAARFMPLSDRLLGSSSDFSYIYDWWLQHLFQFYNVQSLDIIQMPRIPEMDSAFLGNFVPTNQTNVFPITRLWQLTNTRYLLGDSQVVEFLNQTGDPVNRRFRTQAPFDFVPKATAVGSPAGTKLEDITTAIRPDGHYALFEFTGALPRAKLYSVWRNTSNEPDTLKTLADPQFDPLQSVLVSGEGPPVPSNISTNRDPGKVEITDYAPKRIHLKAQAVVSSILLLNERFHPDWKVFVDGNVQPLLRCNYIMRGVLVPQGEHLIEFRFQPDGGALYVSLAAIGVSLVLCVALILKTRHD